MLVKAPVLPGRPDAGVRRRRPWAPGRGSGTGQRVPLGCREAAARSGCGVRAGAPGSGSGVRARPSQRRQSQCPVIGPGP